MTSSVRHQPPFTEEERECLPGSARTTRLRLGTRASELATTQAGWVADRLRALGHQVDLVPVRTEGDASTRPLTEIGGTGVFAAALRRALLEDRIDVAVHSLKDLPTQPEPGLVVAAVPEREDPRDVLVARDGRRLGDLPAGAVVGTGSPRRATQLAELAPELVVREIRGNVDTRIAMVRDGRVDAVVLAAAGLRRLGRIEEATEILPTSVMLPAPGQGALAVECRDDDETVRAAVRPLDDPVTRACVRAERVLLRRLEAGCTAPVGALAVADGPVLTLTGFVGLDGRPRRAQVRGEDPARLGQDLAELLLDPAASPHPPSGTPAGGTDPTERDS